MRLNIGMPAVLTAFLCLSTAAWPQQTQQKPSQTDRQTSADHDNAVNAANQQQAPAPAVDSLAEAARKARAAEKNGPKTTRVFTNDNIPTEGGVSEVGSASQPASNSGATPGNQAKGGTKTAATNDEATWRARFSKLRHKLEQDQAELDIMQRELGVLSMQYYNDPNKAMQQQLSREDIDKKTADIEAKKKQVADDQQAISDAEDDLRKAGGDPGWASQ
ncbi:MAG TPA: hypothetical protein VMF66_09820 [Candidatus Acidoferrum sp.]|nr:hypothetical protein [Candidatus Acidoferrum sp.]